MTVTFEGKDVPQDALRSARAREHDKNAVVAQLLLRTNRAEVSQLRAALACHGSTGLPADLTTAMQQGMDDRMKAAYLEAERSALRKQAAITAEELQALQAGLAEERRLGSEQRARITELEAREEASSAAAAEGLRKAEARANLEKGEMSARHAAEAEERLKAQARGFRLEAEEAALEAREAATAEELRNAEALSNALEVERGVLEAREAAVSQELRFAQARADGLEVERDLLEARFSMVAEGLHKTEANLALEQRQLAEERARSAELQAREELLIVELDLQRARGAGATREVQKSEASPVCDLETQRPEELQPASTQQQEQPPQTRLDLQPQVPPEPTVELPQVPQIRPSPKLPDVPLFPELAQLPLVPALPEMPQEQLPEHLQKQLPEPLQEQPPQQSLEPLSVQLAEESQQFLERPPAPANPVQNAIVYLPRLPMEHLRKQFQQQQQQPHRQPHPQPHPLEPSPQQQQTLPQQQQPDQRSARGGGTTPRVLTTPRGSARSNRSSRLCRLLLHCDPQRKRQFVAGCLVSTCSMDEAPAYMVTRKAQTEGIALVGIYPPEVAEAFCEGLGANGLTCEIVPLDEQVLKLEGLARSLAPRSESALLWQLPVDASRAVASQ